jgi:long-chain acyl-CoA synthetase
MEYRDALHRHEVCAGSRVVLRFESNDWLEYASAFIGCLAANAIAVPISASATTAELSQLVAACEPAMIIARDAERQIAFESVPAVSTSGAAPGSEPHEAIAQLLYTSGTSGLPKCVAASHANLAQGMEWIPFSPERDATERPAAAFHAFPVGTNAGQVRLVETVFRGDPLVVAPLFLPGGFLRAVDLHGIAFAALTPTMGWLIVHHVAAADGDIRCDDLAVLLLTGAPSAPKLLQELRLIFPNATLLNSYACTEAWPAAVTMEYDPSRPTALGRPQGSTAVSIRDGAGHQVPPGTVGAIWMRADDGASSRSYWRAPRAGDNDVFVRGWARTGDLGLIDADGYLFLTDRESDTVNVRGYNVSTVEVEFALMEHPGVLDAAAFGIPDPVDGERLAAAVVLNAEVALHELRAFLCARLSGHKIPGRLCVVSDLPRTLSGKVKKRDLVGSAMRTRDTV